MANSKQNRKAEMRRAQRLKREPPPKQQKRRDAEASSGMQKHLLGFISHAAAPPTQMRGPQVGLR